MRSGGLAPTVLNAANEIAVQAFLDRRIGFLDISRVVGATLDADVANGSNGMAGDLDTRAGRRCARAHAGGRNLSKGGGCKGVRMHALHDIIAATPLGLPAFLFVITVVVFFHELGHFLVARACGVKVDVFSIGFGKEIFGWSDRARHALESELVADRRLCEIRRRRRCRFDARPQGAARITAAERDGMLQFKPLVAARRRRGRRPAGQFRHRHHHPHGPAAVWRACHPAAGGGSVVKGSAAEAAGIRAGDRIVGVNGTSHRRLLPAAGNHLHARRREPGHRPGPRQAST